jgi:hypothetical protein
VPVVVVVVAPVAPAAPVDAPPEPLVEVVDVVVVTGPVAGVVESSDEQAEIVRRAPVPSAKV